MISARLVAPYGPGEFVDLDTGELLPAARAGRSLYCQSVADTIATALPDSRFARIVVNRFARPVAAMGRIGLTDAAIAYPGCVSAEQVAAADDALCAAGCTRGVSPAGRALDYCVRQWPETVQWRVARPVLTAAREALYGGVQFGGPRKPLPATHRVAVDVISSYPYLATFPLPRVRDAAIERGRRPGALLWYVQATQSDSALFARDPGTGETCHPERLSGWYVAEEVAYHEAAGRVRIDAVLDSLTVSHDEPYLRPAVESLYAARQRYREGSPGRAALKSALNGLLGKFAAPLSPWRHARPGEAEWAWRTRRVLSMRIGVNDLISDPQLGATWPRHANALWTALIYARGRVRLWQQIDTMRAAGCRVLWTHTDCVVADCPPSYVPTVGTALGDWRVAS